MKIGIVGLGLIGGSMAKSIRAKTPHRVFGADLDRQTCTLASVCGAIDGLLTEEIIRDCDVIFLAISPRAAVRWAEEHADALKGCLVVDICGVKRTVCQPMEHLAEQHGFSYIGAHPMAGKECSGFRNADADLFQGASMILVPNARTDMAMLELLKELFLQMGFSRLTVSDAEEHDRIIALTSQLAHVVSSAYVQVPDAQRERGFSAGSFQDMTRVARLDPGLWTELMMDNADFLEDQMTQLIDLLCEYRTALHDKNHQQLKELLAEGCEKKMKIGGA